MPLVEPAGRIGSSFDMVRATGSIGPIEALLAKAVCVNGLQNSFAQLASLGLHLRETIVGFVSEKSPFKLSTVGTIALVALFTLRIIVFCHPKKMKLVFL